MDVHRQHSVIKTHMGSQGEGGGGHTADIFFFWTEEGEEVVALSWLYISFEQSMAV